MGSNGSVALNKFSLTLIYIALVLMGCEPASSPTQATDSTPVPAAPRKFESKLIVVVDSSESYVDWNITVPTGGWEMKIERTESDPQTRAAKIYVSLRKPNPEDMVTQARVPHTGSYRNNAVGYTSVDLYVQECEFGKEPTDDGYHLAAHWPDK